MAYSEFFEKKSLKTQIFAGPTKILVGPTEIFLRKYLVGPTKISHEIFLMWAPQSKEPLGILKKAKGIKVKGILKLGGQVSIFYK